MDKDTHKLVRMAFITSPLLAVYNMAPIALLLRSGMIGADVQRPPQLHHPLGVLFPLAIITCFALIIWSLNIWLVRNQRQLRLRTGSRYLLSYLLTGLLVLGIFSALSALRPTPMGFGMLRYYPFIGFAANNTFILIIIDLLLNREKRGQLEMEKAILEAQHMKARHETLKQQIQPHFLFNALNTLKLLIRNDGQKAESYTVRLSRFLRTSISDQLKESLTVAEDLEIFGDFMELQKVRFPDAIQVRIHLSEATLKHASVPAFTFQTLAENAIKHNAFSAQKTLHIEIGEADDQLYFVNNTSIRRRVVDSTGIGLKNLSERFLIGSGEALHVNHTNEEFIVRFKPLTP
ncbi:MAG: histidine kinase [Bacteroidota bacterium]